MWLGDHGGKEVFYVTLMLVGWGCDLCGCVVVSG